MLKSLRVVAPIVGATGVSIALSVSAYADVDLDDSLSGSTNAIFLGGTAEPTPSTAYVEAADLLYCSRWDLRGARRSATWPETCRATVRCRC